MCRLVDVRKPFDAVFIDEIETVLSRPCVTEESSVRDTLEAVWRTADRRWGFDADLSGRAVRWCSRVCEEEPLHIEHNEHKSLAGRRMQIQSRDSAMATLTALLDNGQNPYIFASCRRRLPQC